MNGTETFAPDFPNLTPGILVDGDGFYPAEGGGVRAMPSAVSIGNALAAECLGICSFRDTDMSFRTIAGTASKLYQLNYVTWADVSLAGGYATAGRWDFAAYGNYVLAANNQKKLQVQTSSGTAFAEITEAPVSKYVTVAQEFIICANISSYPNRVQWCAQGDYDEWTEALSTQAGYMDLVDTQGDIRGLARLNNDIVVFKEDSFYHGTYVGPPYVWGFRRISSTTGCKSQDSIVETEHGLYFVGIDDIYFYDGSQCVRVGQGIRKWLFDNIDGNWARNILSMYDPKRRMIFWFYPTINDGTGKPVEGIIFDYQNKRWGRVFMAVEACLVHWASNLTYDTISTLFATYDAITLAYDSPIWTNNTFSAALVTTSHQLSRLSGTPGSSSITTADIGSLKGWSRIYKAWPYFYVTPTTCTVTPRYRIALADPATQGTGNTVKADGSADQDLSGKFLSLRFDMTGDWHMVGFDADIRPVGTN